MRRTLIVLASILSIVSLPASARSKVVMFIVGSTSLNSLTAPDLTNFHRAITQGSVGLMNARTAGTPGGEASVTGLEAACLTLGAGTRAVGGDAVRKARDPDEVTSSGITAGQLWSAKTLLPQAKAEVLQPLVYRITSDNSTLDHKVSVGALGDALHAAGLKTAVIGNSDIPDELHREAAAVAMDASGRVDYGEVGDGLTIRDSSAPFGLAADHDAYFHALDRVWPKADFIVVDAGDTLRASMYADDCTKEQAGKLTRWAVRRADSMLGGLMRRADPKRDLILIVSPNLAHESDEEGGPLTPVIAVGPRFGHGILTSDSTRWRGIVTNTDTTATVLSFFGLRTSRSMVGRPFVSEGAVDQLKQIKEIERSIALRSRTQVLSRSIASFDAVIVLAVTLGLIYWRRSGLLAWLALLPASSALAALLLPLFGGYDLWPSAVGLAVLSIVIVFAAFRLRGNLAGSLAIVSLATSVGLALDLLLGSTLLRESVLSYSASGGARYYGLGNEYMGAVIGATVVGMGIALSQCRLGSTVRQVLAGVVFGSMVLVIGAPSFGTNTGGMMSAVPAALVAFRLRTGRKIRVAHAVAIAAAVAVALVALILVDIHHGAHQSHIGRFGAAVASGGVGQFLIVVQRKLSMNMMLLASSPWSRLLICCAGGIAALWVSGRTRVAVIAGKSYDLLAAMIGSVAGAAAALAFNDSGVVAAAICLIYPWSAAVMLALEKAKD